MPVAAYTDLFNEALDDLSVRLATISGLQVVTDPRNLVNPCVFIGPPSFEAWNYNIVKMSFPCRVISSGPGNLDALRNLLNLSALILGNNVAVTAGRPTMASIAGIDYPAYDLDIAIQAQTA